MSAWGLHAKTIGSGLATSNLDTSEVLYPEPVDVTVVPGKTGRETGLHRVTDAEGAEGRAQRIFLA
jgi:hypothetical protein